MRAVVHDTYGPAEVLHIEDVERPVPAGERGARQGARDDGDALGLRIPRSRPVLLARLHRTPPAEAASAGMELAGIVEEIGSDVTEFAVGDEVFGLRSGANAEYVCVREQGALAHKPESLVRRGRSPPRRSEHLPACLARPTRARKAHRRVRSVGAIGTAAVQLAKATGAHVTAVCNTQDVELVRSLGADDVVDSCRRTSRGTARPTT